MKNLFSLPQLYFLAVITCWISFPPLACGEDQPSDEITGLLLTWKSDPTTTMVVDWHEGGPRENAVLEYRVEGSEEWLQAKPEAIPFPHSDRMIYRCELSGLKPDTLYEFRPGGRGDPYFFRTAQSEIARPIRIAVGGDLHYSENFRKMNRVVADLDVDFIVWGGDNSYSDGRPDRVDREHQWSEAMRDTLITESRRVIPVIAAIGNHEINVPKLQELTEGLPTRRDVSEEISLEAAPYYSALFAFPGHPPYGVLDFGDYLSVIVLSTDHLADVRGVQSDWLEGVLEERVNPPNRVILPIYHVGAYPSVRPPQGHRRVKEYWIPLFEKTGLTFAFENHDHAYKRTHPMLGDQIQERAEDGITYLGDGAWGVPTREPEPEGRPFLAKSGAIHHAFVVEIPADGPLKFAAVNNEGKVFDSFELPRRR